MTFLSRHISIAVFFFIITNVFSQQLPYSVLDDKDRKVTFKSIPERVITLAPSITEFVYAIGCEDKLVGNTLYCNYPPEANDVEKVGDLLTFDYEKIISLSPDLILLTVEGNTKETFDKLNDLGQKLFIVNPRNYVDIKDDFRKVASVFRKENLGESIIKGWDKKVDKVLDLGKNESRKSVMIIVEISPLMLAGKNTFLNEYLEMVNLENIAQDSPLNYPVFNREEVLVRDPDIIVYPSGGTETVEYLLEFYPEWNQLKAFRNDKVVFVDRDMYFRPGPRFVDSLQDLVSKIR